MIEKFLLEGKRNAIKSQKLADLAGCKSVRELQEVIAAERAAGAVILSTCQDGGIFSPSKCRGSQRICRNIGEQREEYFTCSKISKGLFETVRRWCVMAIYRNIQLSFWSDSKVTDDFTPEDKYFYLYLLTNPQTNICGCYQISYSQMESQTGYNRETINRLIERF